MKNRRPALALAVLMTPAALIAGLLLRLWFVRRYPHVSGDTFIYGDIAKSLLEHHIYGFSQAANQFSPTLIRLPGYPFFLAACFALFGHEHYTAVMYTQIAADLITCLLIAAIARRLFGRRAATAALWLSALCPFTANYTAAPLAETLSLTCIALAFYSLYRWQEAIQSIGSTQSAPYNRWLYILAVALSYAILLRPDQGLLAAAILPAMLWIDRKSPRPQTPRKNSLRRIAPAILAAFLIVLPLAPWTLRNWRAFHVIQPLAPRYATDPGEAIPLGFNRWFRTWGIDFTSTEEAYWNYNGDTIALGDLPTRAFDNPAQRTITAALLNDYNQTTIDTPTLNARFAALATERIHASPFRYYVTLPTARLLNMLLRPRTENLPIKLEWWNFRPHPGQTVFAAAYGALNFGYLALAGIGLYRWRSIVRNGEKWNGIAALAWPMIAFITLRTALLLTLDNSEPRYTLEFFPILILWASAAAVTRTPAGAP